MYYTFCFYMFYNTVTDWLTDWLTDYQVQSSPLHSTPLHSTPFHSIPFQSMCTFCLVLPTSAMFLVGNVGSRFTMPCVWTSRHSTNWTFVFVCLSFLVVSKLKDTHTHIHLLSQWFHFVLLISIWKSMILFVIHFSLVIWCPKFLICNDVHYKLAISSATIAVPFPIVKKVPTTLTMFGSIYCNVYLMWHVLAKVAANTIYWLDKTRDDKRDWHSQTQM